jgi:hypothetical protein
MNQTVAYVNPAEIILLDNSPPGPNPTDTRIVFAANGETFAYGVLIDDVYQQLSNPA